MTVHDFLTSGAPLAVLLVLALVYANWFSGPEDA